MNGQLLIISISLYIISIIAALILAIAGKKISSQFFKIFSFAHFSFALALIILFLLTEVNVLSQWLTLLFFCSGLIFSGIIFRKIKNLFIKLYFLLFPFILVFFVYSPARFFKTIYTGDFNNFKSNPIALSNNYFLAQQDIFYETEKGFNYKIYHKKGLINETIATGITTEEKIDSVEILLIEPGDTLVIRTYNASTGSNDISVSLKSKSRRNLIQQK